MIRTSRLLLDVLKPRQPGMLEFARGIVEQLPGYSVQVKVLEIDDQTETVIIDVVADDIDYDALVTVIADLGASVHSIDEIEMDSMDG